MTLAYYQLKRLAQVAGSTSTTNFAYDNGNAIAECDASGALQRRFVF